MSQIKSVTLKCSNCGASLQIGAAVSQLACGYCGSAQQVIREGGSISLELMDSLSRVSQSADRAAAEMAIVRLTKELQQAQANKPMVAADGLQKAKVLREKFGRWVIGAVFIPIIIAAIGGASMIDNSRPASREGLPALLLAGMVISGLAVVGLFIFARPGIMARVAEVKAQTDREIAVIDSRIAEINTSLAANRKIVEAK